MLSGFAALYPTYGSNLLPVLQTLLIKQLTLHLLILLI
jgi:hypothetical protein